MKNKLILRLLILLLLALATPKAQAGWFDNHEKELQQDLVAAEEQVLQQRKATDQWELIAGILGVGCILLFVIGTAIGAKTRHASTQPQ